MQNKEPFYFNDIVPKVSVVVCTYQHVKFIEKCLEGILMQKTDFPFEIIIGEDESTDGTREICLKYANLYPNKIRLFLRSRKNVISINGRPTGRYNFKENLRAARGEYIAYCDGDDYWTDIFKLQIQYDFLEYNPDFYMSYHNANAIDIGGKIVRFDIIKSVFRKNFSEMEIFHGVNIILSTLFFRADRIQYPKEFYRVLSGDYFLFCILALRGGKSKYHKNIENINYRYHVGGLWNGLNILEKKRAHQTNYYYRYTYLKRELDDVKINRNLFNIYIDKTFDLLREYYQNTKYLIFIKEFLNFIYKCMLNNTPSSILIMLNKFFKMVSKKVLLF